MHNVYVETINELMAIEGIAGFKSESEKFAGAEETYTYEPMMSNGWALQICTSHLLGQGFMHGFGVKYLNEEGVETSPYYTSWGLSTRSIGGIISSHSDDKGLIIPPKMSEYQAVILPIYGKDNSEKVNAYARKIATVVAGSENEVPVQGDVMRAKVGASGKALIDFRNIRLGEKIGDFEQSGYPVRIECGERDMENGKCVLASRITGEKVIISLEEITTTLKRMLEEGQIALRTASRKRLEENIVPCYTMEDIGAAMENGKFAIYEWDRNPQFEKDIKELYRATTRCIPFEGSFTEKLLPLTKENTVRVIIARNF